MHARIPGLLSIETLSRGSDSLRASGIFNNVLSLWVGQLGQRRLKLVITYSIACGSAVFTEDIIYIDCLGPFLGYSIIALP